MKRWIVAVVCIVVVSRLGLCDGEEPQKARPTWWKGSGDVFQRNASGVPGSVTTLAHQTKEDLDPFTECPVLWSPSTYKTESDARVLLINTAGLQAFNANDLKPDGSAVRNRPFLTGCPVAPIDDPLVYAVGGSENSQPVAYGMPSPAATQDGGWAFTASDVLITRGYSAMTLEDGLFFGATNTYTTPASNYVFAVERTGDPANPSKGKERWHRPVNGAASNLVGALDTSLSRMVLIVATSNGEIYKFDPHDGKVRNQKTILQTVFVSVAVGYDAQTIYLLSRAGQLYSLDATTFAIKAILDVGVKFPLTDLAIGYADGHDVLYFGADEKLYAVSPDGSEWHVELGRQPSGAPPVVAADQTVYMTVARSQDRTKPPGVIAIRRAGVVWTVPVPGTPKRLAIGPNGWLYIGAHTKVALLK